MRKIKDPSLKQNKKKMPIHPFELVWYIICGLVGIWGITYIVLGLVAEYLPAKYQDGEYVKANAKFAEIFKLDWFGWGLIILAIAAVAAVIVLLIFSNKVDRNYEKSVRRAQRLAQLEQEEAKEEQKQIVDAEVAPVEEAKEELVEEQPVEEEAEDESVPPVEDTPVAEEIIEEEQTPIDEEPAEVEEAPEVEEPKAE